MSPAPRARHRIAWLTLAALTLTAAWLSLDRLQSRRLFLIRLPFDRGPLTFELDDAAGSAQTWMVPALAFLAIAASAVAGAAHTGPFKAAHRFWHRLAALWQAHPWLCRLFLAACIADFLSTARYFHAHRIDDELHPGIKLVTYAFGLSVGCLLGKLIQALLAAGICSLVGKLDRPLLVVLIIAYDSAAIWNVWLG